MFKIGDKVISKRFKEGIVIDPSETICGYDSNFPVVVKFNDNWIQYYTANGIFPAGVLFPDGDEIELAKSR
jgi:hypothetical protein